MFREIREVKSETFANYQVEEEVRYLRRRIREIFDERITEANTIEIRQLSSRLEELGYSL